MMRVTETETEVLAVVQTNLRRPVICSVIEATEEEEEQEGQ
jgi:hypothetical protein